MTDKAFWETENFPPVFTAEEAAAFLRVSKCTILRLANRGLILGSKIGNQWRFSREAILDLIKNSQHSLERGKK